MRWGFVGYSDGKGAAQKALTAVVATVEDTAVGAAKEAANAATDLANAVNAPLDAALAGMGVNFAFRPG